MARDTRKSRGGGAFGRWRPWLVLAALAALCVSTAMAALKVREIALTDPQFTLSRDNREAFSIQGLHYTSRAKVLRVFAGDFGHSIFSVPLAERRRRLLAIDWVGDASVSRIWPDRLVVRIAERKPVAFVFFRRGVFLIDSEGVLLEPPPQAQFAFPVLSGVREEETEASRCERVRCMSRVLDELGSLAREVSEVNAADCENIRIVTQVDRRAVELIMGDSSFAQRYRNFTRHYPEMQKRFPGAKTFDLRLADRIAAED